MKEKKDAGLGLAGIHLQVYANCLCNEIFRCALICCDERDETLYLTLPLYLSIFLALQNFL